MKNGKSLVELAQEIQRQMDAKKDFIVPDKGLTVYTHENNIELGFQHNNIALFGGLLTENGYN